MSGEISATARSGRIVVVVKRHCSVEGRKEQLAECELSEGQTDELVIELRAALMQAKRQALAARLARRPETERELAQARNRVAELEAELSAFPQPSDMDLV